MADGAYQTFRDECLRYEIPTAHGAALIAVECAREAERLGLTLAQARDWARMQLSGKPLHEQVYLCVHRRRMAPAVSFGACARCEIALTSRMSHFEVMLGERGLGMRFCSYDCASLRLGGPFMVRRSPLFKRAA